MSMANSLKSNPAHLNAVYLDQLIDVTDSNVWYDYVLDPVGSHEDISSSNVVFTLPQIIANKASTRGMKNGNSEKTFQCSQCKSRFTNLSNLKSHVRIHTGDKPYVCEICNLSFVQNSNLKAHMRLHTGDRPYKCKDCGKSFARSSHLLGHRRTHTGELPYQCKLCGKSFSTSTQLKKHQEKHEDIGIHMCNMCEKSFSSVEKLMLHNKVHPATRPFRCTYCMASFRSREDLYAHKKLHPGSGCPYICNNCGKGFKIKFCCEKHYEKCVNEGQSNIEQSALSVYNSETLPSNNDNLFNGVALDNRPKINNQEKVFLFDDGKSKEICKMELLEESIEEGIDIEEHTVVVSIDDGILFA